MSAKSAPSNPAEDEKGYPTLGRSPLPALP